MKNNPAFRIISAAAALCCSLDVAAADWLLLSCQPKETMFRTVSVQVNEALGQLRFEGQEVAATFTSDRIAFTALNLKRQPKNMYLNRITGELGYDGLPNALWSCEVVTRRL